MATLGGFKFQGMNENGAGVWHREPQPHCRWCHELVIRGLPCTCERAQKEAARIRADTPR